MALVEKVKAILKRTFPPPDKIKLRDEDGIVGSVTSEKFVGMETIDRINLIWDGLEQELTPEERRRVLLIVAATPLEEDAYSVVSPTAQGRRPRRRKS